MIRAIDRICDFLAILAGIYLVVIMGAIVFQATARTLNYSGSSHIFTFTEYGLLYIAMAASPWLARIKGHVFIEMPHRRIAGSSRPEFFPDRCRFVRCDQSVAGLVYGRCHDQGVYAW